MKYKIISLLTLLITTLACGSAQNLPVKVELIIQVSGLDGELVVKEKAQPVDRSITIIEDGEYKLLTIIGEVFEYEIEALTLPPNQVCSLQNKVGILDGLFPIMLLNYIDSIESPFFKKEYVRVNCVENRFPDVVIEDEFISVCINQLAQINGWFAADEVTAIECEETYAVSVSGLNAFPQLRQLDLSGSFRLISIDLSQLEQLTELVLSDTGIEAIDVSGNPRLVKLEINSSPLTSINLSSATQLARLSLTDTDLTGVDLSGNPNLVSLEIISSPLTNINLLSATQLASLSLIDNDLAEVDLSSNPNLISVEISANKLVYIDLSSITQLASLALRRNQLTELDISANTQLTSLDVAGNRLQSLNLSHTPLLELLDLSGNDVQTIDLSFTPAIKSLDLSFNERLTAVDTTTLSQLSEFFIANIPGINFDVSENLQLKKLHAFRSDLTAIDLSRNTLLERLLLNDNLLTNIDVSNNRALTLLDVSSNVALASIDLSQNNLLESLSVSSNDVISSLDFTANPELIFLDISGNKSLVSVDLSQNTLLERLMVDANSSMSSLDLSANVALIFLLISSNSSLASIDLSANVALQEFHASNSAFSSVDFTYQQQLTEAVLQNSSSLTAIVISQDNNPNLNRLSVSGTCLDPSLVDSYSMENGGWIESVAFSRRAEDCPI